MAHECVRARRYELVVAVEVYLPCEELSKGLERPCADRCAGGVDRDTEEKCGCNPRSQTPSRGCQDSECGYRKWRFWERLRKDNSYFRNGEPIEEDLDGNSKANAVKLGPHNLRRDAP